MAAVRAQQPAAYAAALYRRRRWVATVVAAKCQREVALALALQAQAALLKGLC
jgi:hypothetical protein